MKAILSLKRGEETTTLEVGNLMSVHSMRLISKHLKEGWELIDGSSDNPTIDAYIKNQLQKYQENKEKYKVSIKEVVKVATSIVKPQGKIRLSKRQLLMFKFRKPKDELEKL